MEDKKLYNRIMLIAFCIIVTLLGAGIYSWQHGRKTMPDPVLPRQKVRVLEWEPVCPNVSGKRLHKNPLTYG